MGGRLNWGRKVDDGADGAQGGGENGRELHQHLEESVGAFRSEIGSFWQRLRLLSGSSILR